MDFFGKVDLKRDVLRGKGDKWYVRLSRSMHRRLGAYYAEVKGKTVQIGIVKPSEEWYNKIGIEEFSEKFRSESKDDLCNAVKYAIISEKTAVVVSEAEEFFCFIGAIIHEWNTLKAIYIPELDIRVLNYVKGYIQEPIVVGFPENGDFSVEIVVDLRKGEVTECPTEFSKFKEVLRNYSIDVSWQVIKRMVEVIQKHPELWRLFDSNEVAEFLRTRHDLSKKIIKTLENYNDLKKFSDIIRDLNNQYVTREFIARCLELKEYILLGDDLCKKECLKILKNPDDSLCKELLVAVGKSRKDFSWLGGEDYKEAWFGFQRKRPELLPLTEEVVPKDEEQLIMMLNYGDVEIDTKLKILNEYHSPSILGMTINKRNKISKDVTKWFKKVSKEIKGDKQKVVNFRNNIKKYPKVYALYGKYIENIEKPPCMVHCGFEAGSLKRVDSYSEIIPLNKVDKVSLNEYGKIKLYLSSDKVSPSDWKKADELVDNTKDKINIIVISSTKMRTGITSAGSWETPVATCFNGVPTLICRSEEKDKLQLFEALFREFFDGQQDVCVFCFTSDAKDEEELAEDIVNGLKDISAVRKFKKGHNSYYPPQIREIKIKLKEYHVLSEEKIKNLIDKEIEFAGFKTKPFINDVSLIYESMFTNESQKVPIIIFMWILRKSGY